MELLRMNFYGFLNPKGGDLLLKKVKSRETLIEAWSCADVQIANIIWE